MRLRGLDALRSRNYVLYLVGHFTSQTGAWVEQTAVCSTQAPVCDVKCPTR